jgi:hypothetical protein
MRHVSVCAILVLISAACTHVTPVRPSDPSDRGLEALIQRTGEASTSRREAGPEAAIVLGVVSHEPGQNVSPLVPARSFAFAQDTSSWYNTGTGSLERASTATIREIRFTNRSRGALEGLGLGLLGGAALGALALSQGQNTDGFFSEGDLAWIGAVLGGATGGLVGVVLGALAEHREVYRFEPDASASSNLSSR